MSTYETDSATDQRTESEDVKERAIDSVAEVEAGAMYVAGVAGEEVGSVVHDAKQAARGFFDETRTQLSDQASLQQRRAAGALRSTGDELEEMASGSASGGMATSAVRTIGRQSRRAADWLEQREPADVIHEVRTFARRHTGAFLVIAVGVGIVAGRLTRALVADARSNGHADGRPAGTTRGDRPALVGSGGIGNGAAAKGATAGSSSRTVETSAPGTAATTGDTPIADALANGSGDPASPESMTSDRQEPAAPDSPTSDEWTPSGEVRR